MKSLRELIIWWRTELLSDSACVSQWQADSLCCFIVLSFFSPPLLMLRLTGPTTIPDSRAWTSFAVRSPWYRSPHRTCGLRPCWVTKYTYHLRAYAKNNDNKFKKKNTQNKRKHTKKIRLNCTVKVLHHIVLENTHVQSQNYFNISAHHTPWTEVLMLPGWSDE